MAFIHPILSHQRKSCTEHKYHFHLSPLSMIFTEPYVPLPPKPGLFPIIILTIITQPSPLANWGQSASKSCADVEHYIALGW